MWLPITCSTHGLEHRCIQIFGCKSWKRRPWWVIFEGILPTQGLYSVDYYFFLSLLVLFFIFFVHTSFATVLAIWRFGQWLRITYTETLLLSFTSAVLTYNFLATFLNFLGLSAHVIYICELLVMYYGCKLTVTQRVLLKGLTEKKCFIVLTMKAHDGVEI